MFLRRGLAVDESRSMGVLPMSVGPVVILRAGVVLFFFGPVTFCVAVSCLEGCLDSLVVYGTSYLDPFCYKLALLRIWFFFLPLSLSLPGWIWAALVLFCVGASFFACCS